MPRFMCGSSKGAAPKIDTQIINARNDLPAVRHNSSYCNSRQKYEQVDLRLLHTTKAVDKIK